MILYNVTIKINANLAEDWLDWMKKVHIPDVMNTGMFSSYKICRMLFEDEDGGVTFAVQYFCENMATLKKYQEEHGERLQAEHTERYKDQYIAFRTLMEVLD